MWARAAWAAALALVWASGCPTDGGDDDDTAPPRQAALTDDHNFSYQAWMQADEQPLTEFHDSTIEWGGLTQDVHGRAVDPLEDVDDATLLLFPDMTPDQVCAGLVEDRLQQSDVGLYMVCAPDDTSCRLDEFGLLGSYPGIAQYFEEDRGSWLVMLAADDEAGGIAYRFLRSDASSPETEATIGDDSSSIELDVDLGVGSPVHVAADGDTELDWSGLVHDGLGNDLAVYKLDELLLGRYEEELAVIEDRFYDLEALAADLWTLEVPETDSARLTDLATADGEPFAGFTADGRWLLALRCSTCTNPMPRFVASLEVVGDGATP